MTDDVDKSFFDILAQLKEIDPEAYDKVLKTLESKNDVDTQLLIFQKDLKRTSLEFIELKEKIESSKKLSTKKVPRSLNNLLKVEQDLKKMNLDLKKVVKKVKVLEKENSKLQKKLDKQ